MHLLIEECKERGDADNPPREVGAWFLESHVDVVLRDGPGPIGALLRGQLCLDDPRVDRTGPEVLDSVQQRVRETASDCKCDTETLVGSRWAAMRLAVREGKRRRRASNPRLGDPTPHYMQTKHMQKMILQHYPNAAKQPTKRVLAKVPLEQMVQYSARLVHAVVSEALDWHVRRHHNGKLTIQSVLVALHILGLDVVLTRGLQLKATREAAKKVTTK